jgi:hypothetical protein
MKTYGGVEVWLYRQQMASLPHRDPFHSLWVASRIVWKLRRREKGLPLPGIEAQTDQAIARRYTD